VKRCPWATRRSRLENERLACEALMLVSKTAKVVNLTNFGLTRGSSNSRAGRLPADALPRRERCGPDPGGGGG
jgi:hypothetical protein